MRADIGAMQRESMSALKQENNRLQAELERKDEVIEVARLLYFNAEIDADISTVCTEDLTALRKALEALAAEVEKKDG